VAVGLAALPSVTLGTSVTTEGDLIVTNNSTSEVVAVIAPPVPTIVLTPSTLAAVQQATMGVTLPAPYPFDVSGTVTLQFFSNTSNPLDDPAVRFSNGLRTVDFNVPANTTEARFEPNPDPGPIGFQTGSVAGTLVFTGALTAGTLAVRCPGGIGAAVGAIPPTAPVLQAPLVTLDANGRPAEIQLTIASTTRDVTFLTLNFLTTPAVRPSCGRTLKCAVDGTAIRIDVKDFFDAWYASDTSFGGLSLLRLPLAFEADVHGTVFIALENSAGFSNVVSFILP
jgi:hypothetical protein